MINIVSNIHCDECNMPLDDGDYAYCYYCYNKLKDRIKELETEKSNLEAQLIYAKNEIHKIREEIKGAPIA